MGSPCKNANIQKRLKPPKLNTIFLSKTYQHPTKTVPTPTMVGVGTELGRTWYGDDTDLVAVR